VSRLSFAVDQNAEGDAFDGQSNSRSKKWRYRHSRWGIIKKQPQPQT